MARLGDLIVNVGANVKDFNKKLGQVNREVGRTTGNISKLGQQMSMSLTAPLAFIAGTGVKTFMSFEAQMAKVQAVSGATATEFQRLQENAQSLGSSTRFTASEVAQLQTEFAKLGFSADEITKVTGATLALAQATDSDLARSAEVAGSTLRAFGMDASETGTVTDVMAASFSSTALDMESFAESMKHVAPVAASAGIGIEQTTAMLGVMANAGIKGSQAGTALRRIISDLGTTGGDVATQLGEMAAKGLDLADAKDEVGRNAQSALLVLSKGVGQMGELTTAFEHSEGAAKKMAETMDDTAEGSMKRMQSAIEGAQISIGQALAPAMTKAMDGVASLASSFTDLDSGTKKFIIVAGGIVASLGPIMMILPQMVAGFGMLKVAMLQGVIPAFQRMTAVMLANPWVAAAAAVAALGTAYMIFRDKTTAAEQAQRDLDEALSGAEQSAAKNMVKIDLLAAAVADETMEEEKRIAALNELQRISPDHFGNLDLEAAKTGQLAQSVKTYREEMVRAAKAKAFQGQLEEQVAVMIELENKLKEQEQLYKDIVQTAGAQSGPAEGVLDTMLRISEQLAEQDKVVQAVTDRMAEVSDVSDLITASVQNTTAAVVEQTAAVQSLGEAYAGARQNTGGPMELMATSAAPTGVDTGMGERGLAMPIMPEEGMEEASMGLQAYNEQLNNTLALSSQIGESMGGMFGSMVEGSMTAQEAMKNMAKSVLKSLIGVARANAVAVFSSPTNPANLASGGLAMPAVIAGGLALVESLLGAVAFADGGIVSGPTLGLVGEYSGARSNPEVIAPLDKLQSMIGGGGSQKVVVEGRIQGTDIVMANERGGKNLDRSRSRTR